MPQGDLEIIFALWIQASTSKARESRTKENEILDQANPGAGDFRRLCISPEERLRAFSRLMR